MLNNFVRVFLFSSISDTETDIRFAAPASPWNRPIDPGGEKAYALLLDDANTPTKFELITYTRVEFNRLRGVERGVNGTTAQSWSAGAQITQDLPQALVEVLGLEGSAGEILQVQNGDLLFGGLDYDRIAGKPVIEQATVLSEIAVPSNPASNTARMFLNLATGKLAFQFDNGTLEEIPVDPPVVETADTQTNVSAFGTTINVARPTNLAAGDLVILVIGKAGQSGDSTVVNSPGFTLIESQGSDAGTGTGYTAAYWKIAGASEPANYQIGFGQFSIADVVAIRVTGASAGTPIFADTGNTGSSTGSFAVSGANHADDSLMFWAMTGNNLITPANMTLPAGKTAVANHTSGHGIFVAAETMPNAGSGNNATFNWTPNRVPYGISFTINNAGVP